LPAVSEGPARVVVGGAQGGILAEDLIGNGSRSTLDGVARGRVWGALRLVGGVG
jgi:hypothetical protein